MNAFRCPICLLIPKIINVAYNKHQKFSFRIFCSNNHTEIINLKDMKKYCLNEIKCCECYDINHKSVYYCKNCFNIICEKCRIIHQEKNNHKSIIDINTIDDNCFIHNEKIILYCKNCEESIYNKCIKSQGHKGHEINEIKCLDLEKQKGECKKYKKNLPKNLENYRNELIKEKKIII